MVHMTFYFYFWGQSCVAWNTACQQVLCSPDFDRPFVLQTDTSDCSVGVVLNQASDDGIKHPVNFFSTSYSIRKNATPPSRRMSLHYHRPFTIQTDDCALEWLDWLIMPGSLAGLKHFSPTTKYRAGVANRNTDDLSRMYPSFNQTTLTQEKGEGCKQLHRTMRRTVKVIRP